MYLKKFARESKESKRNLLDRDELAQHFSKVISFYDDSIGYISTLPSFHIGYNYATDKLMEFASLHTTFNNKALLEIGCGLGTSLNYLINTFNVKYTGLDINRQQIELLSKKISNQNLSEQVSLHALNAQDISTNLGKFDIVWSEDTFSHIPNRLKVLINIHKVLNKKGILVFSDLVKKTEISSDELIPQQDAWCLWNLESKETYLQLIRQAEFDVLECIDNIGKTLLEEHLKADITNGDIGYEAYLSHLIIEHDKYIKEWGEFNYNRRLERLKTYVYLMTDKLDYNFYVVTKS